MDAIYVKRNKNTHETKIGTRYLETHPSPPNYDTYKNSKSQEEDAHQELSHGWQNSYNRDAIL